MTPMTVCSYCGAVCDPLHHECGPVGIAQTIYTWEISIGGSRGIVCKMETRAPNRFQRWMYKVLLGWEIRKL